MLNESHRRHLLNTFKHIDRELAEVERLLSAAALKSPFSDVAHDLSPTQSEVIQDYCARIREELMMAVERHELSLDIQRISASWSIQTRLQFTHIAVAEMRPRPLGGYGAVDEESAAAVNQTCADLERLLDRLMAYLHQGLGRDLAERLERLEAAPVGTETLLLLEKIITRHGLVEFRPLLETIVSRLESPRFEIAVFGRVSSGKSSLLNHLLGSPILPVGVTPITAVPTRVTRGHEPVALVSFADGRRTPVALEELKEFVSEQDNAGNRKHVTSVEVRLPAERLREGVVFVDTPGVGSLATAGGAETLAYLPRCDLGIVLLDAGSTLNQEDLTILRLLYETAVPAMILVSKCDLLTPADRARVVSYVRQHLTQDLGLDLPVHLVSTLGEDARLLDQWFDHQIAPLFEQHQSAVAQSLRRKIAHLRESVVAVLETLMGRQHQAGRSQEGSDVSAVEQLLGEADTAIEQLETAFQNWSTSPSHLADAAIERAAARLLDAAASAPSGDGQDVLSQSLREELGERARTVHEAVERLRDRLSITLRKLNQTLPLGEHGATTVEQFALSGLPVPEFTHPGAYGLRVPWLAFPRALGLSLARGRIQRAARGWAGELISSYDRQLQAWAKANTRRLADLYRAQAEVFREQLRRLTKATSEAAQEGVNRADLEEDLKRLRAAEAPWSAQPAPGVPQ